MKLIKKRGQFFREHWSWWNRLPLLLRQKCEHRVGWDVRSVSKDFPWELPYGPRWQRWRRHRSDFRVRRECRESSWGTQKVCPLRAPRTIPPPHSAPTSCTTSSWRPGAPCVNLTPGMTSPSFEFASFELWLHQTTTISWLWIRIQLNKPLSWPHVSFLNLMPPKNNSSNHVNWLRGGNHLRADADQASDQGRLQLYPTPPKSLLCGPATPEFPGGPSFSSPGFGVWTSETPTPCFLLTFSSHCCPEIGHFSLTKINWNLQKKKEKKKRPFL